MIEAHKQVNDSRAKIEHDVHEWLSSQTAWAVPIKDVRSAISEWLDRSAWIAAQEVNDEKARVVVALADKIADLQAQVDELTEQRDRFRDTSSVALDNAHEIERIINQFWND